LAAAFYFVTDIFEQTAILLTERLLVQAKQLGGFALSKKVNGFLVDILLPLTEQGKSETWLMAILASGSLEHLGEEGQFSELHTMVRV